MNWLIFLPQLPATPSSLRVKVWRKMRAAGALGLQNGVWLLPQTPLQERFLNSLLAHIRQEDESANGWILTAQTMDLSTEQDFMACLGAERDEEYSELIEQCAGFLEEVEKESAVGKFTFAELEEAEDDLRKLDRWLRKIQQRDFSGASLREQAGEMCASCRQVCQDFARQVYSRQGVQPGDV